MAFKDHNRYYYIFQALNNIFLTAFLLGSFGKEKKIINRLTLAGRG